MPSSLSQLPGEIRNIIYFYYFLVPGGVLYRHQSGLVCQRLDRRPLPTQLRETCKSIRAETSGMLLAVNDIHFEQTDHIRETYRVFTSLSYQAVLAQIRLLVEAAPHLAGVNAVREVANRQTGRLKQFLMSVVNRSDSCFNDSLNVEVRGICHMHLRKALWEILDNISKLDQVVQNVGPLHNLGGQPSKFFQDTAALQLFDWRANLHEIPSAQTIAALTCLAKVGVVAEIEEDSMSPSAVETAFSAAATAATSLRSIAPSALSSLRQLILWERHYSGWAAHYNLEGFLPLLRANPNLRVERHIDLFHQVMGPVPKIRANWSNDWMHLLEHRTEPIWTQSLWLSRHCLRDNFVPWIKAMYELEDMEPTLRGRFSMICDGVPAVRLGVWAMLKGLAALHEAAAAAKVRNIYPADHLQLENWVWLHTIDSNTMCLVDAVKDIMDGRLSVSFGVDLGSHWCIEDIIASQQGLEDWAWAEAGQSCVEDPMLGPGAGLRGYVKLSDGEAEASIMHKYDPL